MTDPEISAVTDMDVNTNNGQFNRFYALLIGDRPYATLEPDHKIYSELYYTIDGMDTYWTQISDLEDKSILQFITGAKSLDESGSVLHRTGMYRVVIRSLSW